MGKYVSNNFAFIFTIIHVNRFLCASLPPSYRYEHPNICYDNVKNSVHESDRYTQKKMYKIVKKMILICILLSLYPSLSYICTNVLSSFANKACLCIAFKLFFSIFWQMLSLFVTMFIVELLPTEFEFFSI